ncbi:hypothetical protein ACTHSZ_25080, partial [Neisseria sp. P0006.S006]
LNNVGNSFNPPLFNHTHKKPFQKKLIIKKTIKNQKRHIKQNKFKKKHKNKTNKKNKNIKEIAKSHSR